MNKSFQQFLAVFFVVITSIIYLGPYLWRFFTNSLISGTDGISHYAINNYYNQHIFPAVYGWVGTWYTGMPWPLGYSPLLSYSLATIAHTVPVDFDVVFKIFFIVLTLSFPWLIWFVYKKLGFDSWLAALAGFFAILFLADKADFGGLLGISMGGTFENGLYSQLFAAIVFLIWLLCFIGTHNSRRFWLSAILLGLVFISNVHMAEVAGIVFTCFVLSDWYISKDWRVLKKYSIYLLLAFCLSGIWLLPLLETSSYFLSKTQAPVPLFVALTSQGAALLLTGYVLITKRRHPVLLGLSISSYALFLVAVLPLNKIIPGLPLQPFRILSASYLLFFILAPIGITELIQRLKLSGKFRIAGIIILVLPFVFWITPAHYHLAGMYSIDSQIKQMISDVSKNTDGRSVVEAWRDVDPRYSQLSDYKQPTHFIIAALLGNSGTHQTIWNIFRESSIQSPFIQPLRNIFSYNHESYGVICSLCDDIGNTSSNSQEFYLQNMTAHLERARLFGIKYFLLRSPQRQKTFDTRLPEYIKPLNQYGNWRVYEDIRPTHLVETLPIEPTLVFSELKTSDRPYGGPTAYDWLRLNEEWFFWTNFKNVLVRANDQHLDSSTDIENFNSIFITHYSYGNIQTAYKRLIAAAQTKNIILLKSDDRLYQLLMQQRSTDKRLHIFSIDRTGNVRQDIGILMRVLDVQSVRTATSTAQIQVQNNTEIRIGVGNDGTPTYVYLKNSYFPWWHDKYGGDVYMASPAMTLIRTSTSTISLEFKNSRSVWIGGMISLLTLMGIVGHVVVKKNN